MRKRLVLACSVLAVFFAGVSAAAAGTGRITDCTGALRKFIVNRKEPEKTTEEGESGRLIRKEFGTYIIPEDWEENEEHSTGDKFFYVLQGTGSEEMPNNISVNMGTSRYAESEHEQFRQAILQQLNAQVAGAEGIVINGSGSYTDRDYILYTFTIEEETGGVTTTQYYIVGDYRYVLVHETVFGEPEGADEAAQKIINSFEWND